MGRIKTTLIKRVSLEIVDKYSDRFKDNFEENKKIVAEVADIPSKKLRNSIVGYVTRLIKANKGV